MEGERERGKRAKGEKKGEEGVLFIEGRGQGFRGFWGFYEWQVPMVGHTKGGIPLTAILNFACLWIRNNAFLLLL